MTDPQYATPGRLIPSLALDACLPLYGLLHVPPNDGNLRMHDFMKQVVDYAKFTPNREELWLAAQSYAKATLAEADAKLWLGWVYNAYGGLHPPDVDLSGWLMAIAYFRVAPAAWANADMNEDNINVVNALIDRYFSELNESGFIEAVEECQAQPLTAWDKRMHQAYDFVYFDRARGADPFLALKFVNQGEAFRRALRATNLADPVFPAVALQQLAQALIDERGVWMPPGRKLGPLSTLL